MIRFLVIADDFTGALDTAVKFSDQGFITRVDRTFDSKEDWETANVEVLSICVPTRHVSPEEAYEKVAEVVRKALREQVCCIFKKTDSVLRGNIGAELEAVMDAGQTDALHFIPALPKMNRITEMGVHLVGGLPVSETIFGKDPFDPVRESYIPNLLNISSKEIRKVATGEELKDNALDPVQGPSARTGRPTLFIYDSKTDNDISDWVRSLNEKNQLKFVAGCSGLAEALAGFFRTNKQESKSTIVIKRPLVVISGSLHPVSDEQVKMAAKNGFQLICISKCVLLSKATAELYLSVLGQTLRGADSSDRQKQRIIFQFEELRPEEVFNEETREDIQKKTASEIAAFLGELAVRISQTLADARLFIIGGDTLLAVMKAIGTTSVYPVRELQPGVVLSIIEQGSQSLEIISKSGGFGHQDLLLDLAFDLT